jgi:hypothetical protein
MRKIILTVNLTVMGLLFTLTGFSQSIFDGVQFSGQLFLTYEVAETPQSTFNEFRLERGYITFRKSISDRVGVRFTQDITIDQEGDGEGDIELRLKYAFVHYTANNVGVFHSPVIEFGVVRRPWTDFEQRINDYRMQGSMYLDREKISRSADYGVTVSTLLGPILENYSELNLDKSYAGKFGSLALGVYNGGGYAALERNNNKLVEGRLTVRPLWELIPGLQLTYAGSYGKGNAAMSPDFWKHLGYVSYSSRKLVVAAQGYHGVGDLLGGRLDSRNQALPMNGFSVFSEIMPFSVPLSLVTRFETLNNRQTDSLIKQRGLAGVAWRFKNGSIIMLDFEREANYTASVASFTNRWEIATEIRF